MIDKRHYLRVYLRDPLIDRRYSELASLLQRVLDQFRIGERWLLRPGVARCREPSIVRQSVRSSGCRRLTIILLDRRCVATRDVVLVSEISPRIVHVRRRRGCCDTIRTRGVCVVSVSVTCREITMITIYLGHILSVIKTVIDFSFVSKKIIRFLLDHFLRS